MITAAVLGSPISHSLSPVLHMSAFQALEIEGRYSAIEVKSGDLRNFMENRGDEFDYLSLTMPLKEEALTLALASDERTSRIKSANTIFSQGGNRHLASTDGSGFIAAISNAGISEVSSTLILGAGGTARAIAAALDGKSSTIEVMGRTSSREEAFAACVRKSVFTYSRWRSDLDFNEYNLIVNTTPAGAADTLTSSVVNGIRPYLFDVIYKPWPTELGRRWSDCGGSVINGLELLLYQGIDQLELYLGTHQAGERASEIDRDWLAPILRRALLKAAQ